MCSSSRAWRSQRSDGHVFTKMVMEKKWRQEGGQTQVTAAEVRTKV